MDLNKIEIIGAPLVLSNNSEVEEAETALDLTFPRGYREYITTLGEGILDSYLRVYPPWRISTKLEEWRDRIRQYWFWDAGKDVLTDEQVEESIVFADTIDGDELIFHPTCNNRLYVLPRHHDLIFEVGVDLFDAIRWFSSSGILVESFVPASFEPFNSRLWQQSQDAKSSVTESVRQEITLTLDLPSIGTTPEEVLRNFFIALENWERAAQQEIFDWLTLSNSDDSSQSFKKLADKVYLVAAPFITENFDVGKLNGIGFPNYGKTGPRIDEVHITNGIAEIITIGTNNSEFDETKLLFRLVQHGDSWRVDGLWEITKNGRRKRVKLFS